jgi:hypothetical protein
VDYIDVVQYIETRLRYSEFLPLASHKLVISLQIILYLFYRFEHNHDGVFSLTKKVGCAGATVLHDP